MVVLAPAAINKSLPKLKLMDSCKRRAPLLRNITRETRGACGQKQAEPHGPQHAAPKTSEDPRAGINWYPVQKLLPGAVLMVSYMTLLILYRTYCTRYNDIMTLCHDINIVQ